MILTAKQKAALARLKGQARKSALAQFHRQRQLASQQPAAILQPRPNQQQRLPPTRGRRLAAAPRRRNPFPAMAQAALVQGLGRMKLTSAEMYRGGARSNAQFAPRGHGYYDAFTQSLNTVVLASSVGPVTPIAAHARLPIPGDVGHIAKGALNAAGNVATYTINPGSTNVLNPPPVTFPTTNSKIFVFNVGSSDEHVGFAMYPNVEGGIEVLSMVCSAFTGLAHPYQSSAGDQEHHGGSTAFHAALAGDVESIPLRGSVQIMNTTEERFQGGVVRVLRYNGGLLFGSDEDPSDGTPATNLNPTVDSYFKLRDMIRDSSRTHHFSGRDFATMRQFNLHPADFIRSHTFSADKTLYDACLRPRFNTLLVLIDDFTASGTTSNNSYEVNCMVQRAARFAPGTLHHNNSKELKTDPAALSKATDSESKSLGKQYNPGGGVG